MKNNIDISEFYSVLFKLNEIQIDYLNALEVPHYDSNHYLDTLQSEYDELTLRIGLPTQDLSNMLINERMLINITMDTDEVVMTYLITEPEIQVMIAILDDSGGYTEIKEHSEVIAYLNSTEEEYEELLNDYKFLIANLVV